MTLEQFLKPYLRTGDFQLSSGERSSEYLDVRAAILAENNGIAWQAFGLIPAVDAFAGVVLGGALLALRLAQWRNSVPALAVRAEPKQHGLQQQVEGLANVQPGAMVALVEDVVTSGGSVLRAADALHAAGLRVVHVLAVVDREQGGLERVRAALPGVPVLALTTLEKVRGA